MAVSEQVHALAALLLGMEIFQVSWVGGWVSPVSCPDKVATGKNVVLSVIESRFSSPHY
jgi:hypothetical protein